MIIPEENNIENTKMKENEINQEPRKQKDISEKFVTIFITLVIIIALFALFYTAKSLFFPARINTNSISGMATKMSRMSLTPFDIELAKEFMDKDNNGKCDVCGMPVEQCIDSGQLQCDMDSKSTIGILGSQHIHADFKVYINNKALNFAQQQYYMKSSFIHLDEQLNKEDASGTLHMHATGVPLWIFFESIELEFPNEMKAYVNGKQISDYKNYVFNDLDKILITDGKGNLQEELNSITEFAKAHSK